MSIPVPGDQESRGDLSQPLVVVASFRQAQEAEMARATLAAQGIAAVVGRDAAAGGPWIGIAVQDAHAEQALEVLEGIWGTEAARAPESIALERCPDCGSESVARLPRLRLLALAALLLIGAGALTGQQTLFLLTLAIVAAVILAAPNRRCRNCGERWSAAHAVAAENAVETPEVACPRCGSQETSRIDRRRENAITLLVNLAVPPLVVLWPFLPRRRCAACQHQWW